MNLPEYGAHVFTAAAAAHEKGDYAECIRLLNLLIDVVREKRDEMAKELKNDNLDRLANKDHLGS